MECTLVTVEMTYQLVLDVKCECGRTGPLRFKGDHLLDVLRQALIAVSKAADPGLLAQAQELVRLLLE